PQSLPFAPHRDKLDVRPVEYTRPPREILAVSSVPFKDMGHGAPVQAIGGIWSNGLSPDDSPVVPGNFRVDWLGDYPGVIFGSTLVPVDAEDDTWRSEGWKVLDGLHRADIDLERVGSVDVL